MLLISLSASPVLAGYGTVHATSKTKYTRAHTLGDNYQFDAKDGWNHVNITNLAYKYAQSAGDLGKRHSIHTTSKLSTPPGDTLSSATSVGDILKNVVNGVFKGLKALGNPQPVTITW